MKSLFFSIAIALAAAAASAAPQWRIATVDLEKVFAAHPKTAAAEAELKEQETVAEDEMRQLNEELRTRRAELEQARDAARSPLLSEEARAAKRAAVDEKETALEELLVRARKTQESRLRQLREQLLKTRQGIVEEMQGAMHDFADSQGYALILDVSGFTMNGVPAVAYSRPSLDVTEALIQYIQNGATSSAPSTDLPASVSE